jgi:hypothetical protein
MVQGRELVLLNALEKQLINVDFEEGSLGLPHKIKKVMLV